MLKSHFTLHTSNTKALPTHRLTRPNACRCPSWASDQRSPISSTNPKYATATFPSPGDHAETFWYKSIQKNKFHHFQASTTHSFAVQRGCFFKKRERMQCFAQVDPTTTQHPSPDAQKGLSLDLAARGSDSSVWAPEFIHRSSVQCEGTKLEAQKPRLWLGTACGSGLSGSTAPAPGSASRAHPSRGTHHWKQRVQKTEQRWRLTGSQPEEEGTPGWCLTGNRIFLLSFLILNTPCCVFLLKSFYVMSKWLKRKKYIFSMACQHSCCLPLTVAVNFQCQLAWH